MAELKKLLSASCIFLFIVLSIALVSKIGFATPTGLNVSTNTSSTYNPTVASRSDDGGTITTLNVNANQQVDGWKGYVGNLSGEYVLSDSSGYSLYNWNFSITTGEVYISRSSNLNFSNPQCADQTVITAEQTLFGMLSTDVDTINKTFNETKHANFRVGVINITNSTCRTSYLNVNDTKYVRGNESNKFQEVLLQMNGTTKDIVYVALLETDALGYNPTKTYDFQAIVPDNRTYGGVTTYYFWAELGY